jgi:hypothetical protein
MGAGVVLTYRAEVRAGCRTLRANKWLPLFGGEVGTRMGEMSAECGSDSWRRQLDSRILFLSWR